MRNQFFILLFIFLVVVGKVMIIWRRARKTNRLKKDFLISFGICFNDPNAKAVVIERIEGAHRALENNVLNTINLLKSNNLSKDSLLKIWYEQDEKIKREEVKFKKIRNLAKYFGYI